MYEIKNAVGKTIYQTEANGIAIGYYHAVKNNCGYAELWYNGKCIFKTN